MPVTMNFLRLIGQHTLHGTNSIVRHLARLGNSISRAHPSKLLRLVNGWSQVQALCLSVR